MKRILHLDFHRTHWASLKNKQICNGNVLISDYGNVHLRNGPVFIGAKNIFLYECDKNFIHRWINNTTFPNVKNVYINSYCPEPGTLKYYFDTIYAVNCFGNDLRNDSNVNIISEEEWDALLREYKEEGMIVLRNSYCTPLIE